MKKLFTLLLLMPVLVAAQSISAVYDFKVKTVAPVVVVAEERVFNDLFGQEWFDLDVLGFVGASAGPNRSTLGMAGTAIAWQPEIARNFRLQLGVVGRIETGRPIATGFLVGVSARVSF